MYDFKSFLANVYVPQEKLRKKELWNMLEMFMTWHLGEYIGDFDVVGMLRKDLA